jgi:DNA repair photolyase
MGVRRGAERECEDTLTFYKYAVFREVEIAKLANVEIRESAAKSILTPVSGFLAEAGFTHSLSPARNCTYGCTYCYVPTMGLYGGLKPEDWERWGQFTTLKANAAALASKQVAPGQVIYCSPLVDPYQPAEKVSALMRAILETLVAHPPQIFVLQTRAPLVLRDLDLLKQLSARATVRISMSITTDRDEVRRCYEPHCEPNAERLLAIGELRRGGIEVYATLAPLLPCHPEKLAEAAIAASGRTLIGDPLHVRANKPHGATTRQPAITLARRRGEADWFHPQHQNEIVKRIQAVAANAGLDFVTGPKGFGLLARCQRV